MGVRLAKNVEQLPEGYTVITDEELADRVQQSAEPGKFETAGTIRKGWLSDIWTISEDDKPEVLVDCE